MLEANNWTLQFDGGIRGGNPGGIPTYGCILLARERVVMKACGVIDEGVRTNNVAEYQALWVGLCMAWIWRNSWEVLTVRGDSQLIIRQMEGKYNVNSDHLMPLYLKCRDLVRRIETDMGGKAVEFVWNQREKNKLADSLANHAYDQYGGHINR